MNELFKEPLIKIPTAKLAKKKGFDLRTPAFYGCDNPAGGGPGNNLQITSWVKWEELGNDDPQDGTMIYSVPTQGQLEMWLRKKYNIYVRVATNSLTSYFPMIEIVSVYGTQMKGPAYTKNYRTYEEAMEVALVEGLKLIEIE